MQEERDTIGALFAAHIAGKHVIIPVIAHVNGVQNGILKRDTAKFAIVHFDGGRCGLWLGNEADIRWRLFFNRFGDLLRGAGRLSSVAEIVDFVSDHAVVGGPVNCIWDR